MLVGKSKKCELIVANNPGLKTIENINDIIVGKEVDMEKTLAQHAMYFKYALVTSVEDTDIIMSVFEDN